MHNLYLQILKHILKHTTETTTNDFSDCGATDRVLYGYYFVTVYIL